MDPFHVVRLAGEALDLCRRRVQLATCGHRGYKGDPLYSARRTLHTEVGLLTEKQADRLQVMFADDVHVEVDVTWGVYQRMISAYREPDRAVGRELMRTLDRVAEPQRPERSDRDRHPRADPQARAADVLSYFDRPGTSTGPTEAISGRLEHLRGSALGFRNITSYIARSLLETGESRPQLHPGL